MSGNTKVKIGVLAIQGSFAEHCAHVRRAGGEAVEDTGSCESPLLLKVTEPQDVDKAIDPPDQNQLAGPTS